MTADRAKLRLLAELLADERVFDDVMGAIADARDAGPRLLDSDGHPADVDSGDVLEDVLAALRSVA